MKHRSDEKLGIELGHDKLGIEPGHETYGSLKLCLKVWLGALHHLERYCIILRHTLEQLMPGDTVFYILH